MQSKYFVYALCDPRKDFMPFYIGKGTVHEQKGIFARWFGHLRAVRNGKKNHRSNKLRKIFREGSGVGFEILSWWESEKDAYAEEKRVIAEIGLENLTNDRKGGEGGYKASPEQKRKMSEAHKGLKRSSESIKKGLESKAGYKHSEESKRKMSESQKGHPVSLEARLKMSRSHKGMEYSEETKNKHSKRSKGNQYRLGHKPSEETKRKISKSLRIYHGRVA